MGTRQILLAVGEDDTRARVQAEHVTRLFDPSDTAVVVHHSFTDNPEGAYVDQVAAVRRAREVLENRGFDVSLTDSSGEPAAEIVEVAAGLDVAAICIGARRRSPAGKAIFGSTAQRVLLDADRPVLVVPRRTYDD